MLQIGCKNYRKIRSSAIRIRSELEETKMGKSVS